MTLDPRTPVLVGVGVAQQRVDDPATAREASALMLSAAVRAGGDAGDSAILGAIGIVLVPKGMWAYHDPGRLVAAGLGIEPRTVLAEIGVLQQTLLTRACLAIAQGDVDVALVCGGEAKYRELRARITGTTLDDARVPDTEPDEVLAPQSDVITRLEIERGLAVPAHQYAVIETALRASQGLSVSAHAAEVANLCSGFSRVAAANPDAWRTTAVEPATFEQPSTSNPMLAAPYTKLHCSQWNVDQAAAILLCSVEAAERHRIPRDRWVFPLAAVESNAMVALSHRAELSRCRAFRIGGERLAELSGIALETVEHVDLYSCFPAAVRVQARELGLDKRAGALTVTGGMTFAGGPLNNYTYQALAKMVERLRAEPGTNGLVTTVSGMLTKQGLALWSTQPRSSGFAFADISDDARAATATVEVDPEYRGIARIDGYTVVHRDGNPATGVVLASTPDGRRAIGTNDDPVLAAAMTAEEWCGREVRLDGARFDAS